MAFLSVGLVVVVAAIAGLSAIGYVVGIASSAPSLGELDRVRQGQDSIIFASGGERLGVIENDVLSNQILSTRMPQTVRDATVAIEDRRFYQHQGVDFEAVVRAAVENLESGETVEGGSTLTMQLVRNLYPITRDRTFKRKIREAKLAEELENAHPGRVGKEWILTKYLNSVPYGTVNGQTAVGIQAAARIFFDKSASDLELHESALLAGLPQAPSAYNPFREEGAATARRNDVLRAMARQGHIEESTAQEAMQRPLGVKGSGYYSEKRESYFFDYVKDELIREYGVETVRGGGLRVKTTVDLDMQQQARKAISDQLSFAGAPSSAIVSIDPKSGYIRAMASSANYQDSKFNLAAQGKRQPGSAFKTMALVAAVDQGINPASVRYTSKRLKFTAPGYGPIDVNCYGGRCAGGSMNLIRATLRSDNSVYTQLALDLGPDKVVEAARGLGIKSELNGYPSETLGGLTRCCSPLEMANAYATIVNGGWRSRPKAITEVRFPDGQTDDLSKPRRHKAFSRAAMYEVVKILDQNVPGGTGARAQLPNCPAGGKTGTTDRNTDAWFVGFTPKLSTSVWVGFPRGRVPMGNLFNGGPVDGGTFPAEIWGNYMEAVSSNCGEFAKPATGFVSRPFSGRYASGRGSTGPGDTSDFGGTQDFSDPDEAPAPADPDPAPPSDGGDPGDTGGGGGVGFDPELYESPPQNPPG